MKHEEYAASMCIIGTWEYRYGGEDYVRLTFSGEAGRGAVVCESYDDGDHQALGSSYTYAGGILKMFSGPWHPRDLRVVSLSASALVLRDWPFEGNCVFARQLKVESQRIEN